MAADGRSGGTDPIGELGAAALRGPSGAAHSEHLLKVVGAETSDAKKVWAELWHEFKDHITANGMVMPEMEEGFVPACGWREFMEKFWLLKHHLDSASRVCTQK